MPPLLFPLLALTSGIVLSSRLATEYVWICLAPACLLTIVRRRCALIAIFLLGAGLRSLEPAIPVVLETEASRVVGQLTRRPEWRGLGVYLDLQVLTVDGQPRHGRARLTEFLDNPELLSIFNGLRLGTGDRVEIVVRLHRPVRYRNPGVFDFRRFLQREGVYWTGTIRNPRLITVLEQGPWLWRQQDRLRDWVESRLERIFSEDPVTRGLVMGMVLGKKHYLTADVERQFQAGGLYHVLVVSGFNLAIVAMAAAWLSRIASARRALRLAIVIGAVFGYAFVVGGQTPVIRATVMACLLVASKALDRDYFPANAIAFAAFLTLVADPSSLEDPSFQLTFAAVTAVACVGLPATRWVLDDLRRKLEAFGNAELDGWLPPDLADWRLARRMWCELYGLPHAVVTIPWRIFHWLAEALIISLAVELVLAYFMVESFHRISPVSVLLNIPGSVFAGAITPVGLLLIGLPAVVAGPVAGALQGLAHLLVSMLNFALTLPYATLRVPSAPGITWLAYTMAAVVTVFAVYRRKHFLCALGFVVTAAFQVWIVVGDFSPLPPAATTVTFLDVGQGDSALIEFPDGRRMLIDGGGVAAGRFLGLRDESTFSIGEDVVSAYLFARRIRKLDVVVLTHAHNDHLDGLGDVLANFKVGELWLGRNPMIPAYRSLIDQAQLSGVPLRLVSAGDQVAGITVLHPPPRWRVRKAADNNDSAVLLLRSGDQTALFTGDLELAIPVPRFVNLFKVPHHGSRGVRLAVKSDVRVISVGANNPFGHPHPSTLPALRTDTLGAIEVQMVGERPVVRLAGLDEDR